MKPYILNGFLLVIPVLIWNLLLVSYLPWPFNLADFGKGTPSYFLYAELVFRILLFITLFLMPLKTDFKKQLAGWIVYFTGLIAYGASWLLLVKYTNCFYHKTLLFLMPSLTPAIWITGIILLTDNFSFGLPYKRALVIAMAICFLFFHNLNIFLATSDL